MLVSELRDSVNCLWHYVEFAIDGERMYVTNIKGNKVFFGQEEPMFGHEILEELEGKYGKLEIKKQHITRVI